VIPYTVGDYLSGLLGQPAVPTSDPAFQEAEAKVKGDIDRWMNVKGTKSVDHYHSELGKIVWDYIGMARDRTGLEKAISEIPALRDEFRKNVRVLGNPEGINQSLEKVMRVDDFFELAELMARDALNREESCGGHFRVEHQDEEGEAQRDDENFAYVGAWEWTGPGSVQELHKEPLTFDYVHPSKRSYK
jgi:succinate dehydrogenase / fumarate reductase flavoprotein subunit